MQKQNIGRDKKYCFVATILFFLSISLTAQTWKNPADKYINAYKKYVNATCPIPKDSIRHFIYFSRDRESIINHPLLFNSRFKGAQIMYSWKQLEPTKGQYNFSIIEEDIAYLKKHGKKLFIQLQDVTFDKRYKAVPNYLLTKEYDGGAVLQYNDAKEPEGWVAKRWDKRVQERFATLLMQLGNKFNNQIEGINLQETAVGVSSETDKSFTEATYVQGIKNNMAAVKKAFPDVTTMIYANFIPGEWLPFEDKGYLKGIYKYGQEIGVGLGGPDLMVNRKGQLNHALSQMHEGTFTVPLGIAIQDGNYVNKTGADSDYDEYSEEDKEDRKNLVPMLNAFAKDFLKVTYMFWVDQSPYFEEDVLPCFVSD